MKNFTLHLDYYGLLNLHKALLEAKFHHNPDNELVTGSPIVAEVYIQARNLLLQSDYAEQWEAWFQLKNRPDYRKRAITRIRKNDRWEYASDDEKKRIVEAYLAPFLFDDAELTEVTAEIESAFKAHI